MMWDSVGFTGTRHGLTPEQKLALIGILNAYGYDEAEIHLGDAIGADDEARQIARNVRYWLHGHPSDRDDQRAFGNFDFLETPLPPLERNRVIVDSAEALIACPSGFSEVLRSGTWATVRYARRTGVPVIIIWPDGTTTGEHAL